MHGRQTALRGMHARTYCYKTYLKQSAILQACHKSLHFAGSFRSKQSKSLLHLLPFHLGQVQPAFQAGAVRGGSRPCAC